MEDLKQIQEFFSKPLEEGKQLDQVDFAKVVKAVEQTGHPVTVLLVPKFNEIEVLTGMNAPDDILFDLSNAVDSLGYGRNDIIIAGDSSNLSRREYSDIRRVNGGAKDYFEEATKDEETEFHKKLDTLVHDTFGKRKGEMEEYNTGIYYKDEKTQDKTKDGVKLGIEKVKDVLKKIMKEQESNPDAELKVGDYQTKYFYICPGAKSLYQDIEDKVEDMGLAIRAAKLQDALFAIEASALESGATEAEVFAAQSIADQIMAMAAMMGLDKEHSYIQGHVDKIKGTLNENAFIAMMGANSVKDKDKPKEKDEKDYSNEAKVEVDDTTEFKLDLRHLLDKHSIKETIKFIKENNPSSTAEEVIAELKEIKELGEVLEEKLCKKGEAYRKRRIAAGEKSSAYLSGRAVKVCKGQMSGKKKK